MVTLGYSAIENLKRLKYELKQKTQSNAGKDIKIQKVRMLNQHQGEIHNKGSEIQNQRWYPEATAKSLWDI